MSVQQEQETRRRFDTVQDGYDPAAVDRVIDSLEQALDDLAAKYEGLEQADVRMRAMLQTANERVRHQEEELAVALDAAREQAPVEALPALDGEDAVRASSEWAARLLAISTRDAEKMVAEAREQADRLVANARTEAARTIQQNLAKLHVREEALEVKEEEQRKALDRMREETLLELETRRDEVEADVRRLREFEARSRTELVSYFREQLEVLERPQVVDIKVGARVGESRAS
jgi:cell division septum initiation protein DivIVA